MVGNCVTLAADFLIEYLCDVYHTNIIIICWADQGFEQTTNNNELRKQAPNEILGLCVYHLLWEDSIETLESTTPSIGSGYYIIIQVFKPLLIVMGVLMVLSH